VSQLIVAEANLLPGGGAASRRIAADTEADFIRTGLPQTLQHLRDAVLAGETDLGFIASSWAQADPRGIYGNARMLVDLPEDFAAKFFALALPRDFFFGEKSLGAEASADSPDPDLLKQHGVGVSVIAGVGHELMRGNPGGFAEALAIALTR
jgi:pimeloyl-ACP methyl ester carboxylesterase